MEILRIRDRGIFPGSLMPGTKNCITDVSGVCVEHETILEEDLCTGVTAILPHSGDLFQEKVTGAAHIMNGFTKCTGLLQVQELGTIETPIMLTNTLNVGKVSDATIDYMVNQSNEQYRINSINPVILECNDGYLNNIQKRPVEKSHVYSAINNSSSKKVKEGSVGAGTGMITFGFKGGIGSSSRVISWENRSYTLGTLVLSNFGSKNNLEIQGIPVGKYLNQNNSVNTDQDEKPELSDSSGSIIMILATDIPLNSRQLKRIAKRAPLGLSKVGGFASHGSGEVALAFSNVNISPFLSKNTPNNKLNITEEREHYLSTSYLDHPQLMNNIFQAAVETVEESVLNALSCSNSITAYQDRTVKALPWDEITHLFNK
ncbi:P1 family peptidase [Natranaerobius thermophilus]|uniref:Peptidase S58 DmpA n=1 Tax=Natranaerobius thermophilus (strain ATCC BAA-1301 / DSM 18059 / JW/NM-WN-LF) TaxID=457570 RepID=B2A3K9_NATTJ|nr:P1 family peptidase [Natranaerobius thermophilus]ACB86438.1 peptidase S58 DmpA [Natranaerobius thermophilus JW/NM-WN-LF]